MLPPGHSDRPVLVATARKNEAYRQVCVVAVKRLGERGFFRISEVIEAAGMTGMDFYWRALEKMIEADFGEEILPVTDVFFKRRPSGKTDEQWARECSVNAGRRLKAGFAAFRDASAPVVNHVLKTRRNSAIGAARRVNAEIKHAQRELGGGTSVPMLEGGSGEP